MEKKNQKRSKSSRLVKILGGLLAVLALALAGAGYYFFNIAVVPGKKSFVTNGTVKLTKSTPQYKQKLWYKQVTKQHWQLRSAKNNYLLRANYIPAKNSAKTVIILHGYMSNKENMGPMPSFSTSWAIIPFCQTRKLMGKARVSMSATAGWRKTTSKSGPSR